MPVKVAPAMLEICTVKRFEALLPVHSAPDIIDQLSALQVENLTATKVRVIDRQNPRKMIYRGCVYDDCTSSRIKVDVNVFEADAEVAEALLKDDIL